MNLKFYITDQGEQSLKKFTYKGGSSGLSYKYVWSPLAEYLCKFVPIWWAPNAITFTGFILVILAQILVYSTGKLGDPLSNLQLLLFSILIFTYQTLDNIDGKQARRTKTSTPLGMLMDHGCDAMSCYFLCNCVLRIIMVKDQEMILWGTYCILFIFYISVWAQYYSNGVMNLGMVNAVDDGIPLIWFLSLLTIYTGQEFWNVEAFRGIPRNILFIYMIFGACIFQTLSLTMYAGKVLRNNLKYAFKDLAHEITILLSIWMITRYTDWYKVERYHNVILFSLGFMMVRDTMSMQLCVVTEQKYNQFMTANLVYSLAYPLYIITHKWLNCDWISQNVFLYGLLAFFCLNYLHFQLSIWTQMADMLSIKVFSIRNKPSRRKWQAKKTKTSINSDSQQESKSD